MDKIECVEHVVTSNQPISVHSTANYGTWVRSTEEKKYQQTHLLPAITFIQYDVVVMLRQIPENVSGGNV